MKKAYARALVWAIPWLLWAGAWVALTLYTAIVWKFPVVEHGALNWGMGVYLGYALSALFGPLVIVMTHESIMKKFGD